jgi:hypothetical protein
VWKEWKRSNCKWKNCGDCRIMGANHIIVNYDRNEVIRIDHLNVADKNFFYAETAIILGYIMDGFYDSKREHIGIVGDIDADWNSIVYGDEGIKFKDVTKNFIEKYGLVTQTCLKFVCSERCQEHKNCKEDEN